MILTRDGVAPWDILITKLKRYLARRWRIHRNAGKAGGWQKLKVLRDNCTRQEKGDFPMAAMKQMAEELAAAGYGEVRTTARGGMEYRYLIPKGGSGGQ